VAGSSVVTKPPAPAPAEPANVNKLAEGVAESGDAATPTVASTLPTADQETSVSGGGVPPPVEQETTEAPPLADRGGEDGTTDPPLDASMRRMEEVVSDLPPIPLKFLVLAMLGGDGWKPSKGPQVDDRGEPQVTPPSGDPVSTTTTVSTRKWLLVVVLCLQLVLKPYHLMPSWLQLLTSEDLERLAGLEAYLRDNAVCARE
jgi:hypothetical protein